MQTSSWVFLKSPFLAAWLLEAFLHVSGFSKWVSGTQNFGGFTCGKAPEFKTSASLLPGIHLWHISSTKEVLQSLWARRKQAFISVPLYFKHFICMFLEFISHPYYLRKLSRCTQIGSYHSILIAKSVIQVKWENCQKLEVKESRGIWIIRIVMWKEGKRPMQKAEMFLLCVKESFFLWILKAASSLATAWFEHKSMYCSIVGVRNSDIA